MTGGRSPFTIYILLMRVLRCAGLSLGCLVAWSVSLAAQRVSGRVREATAAAPIAGAVVSLLDSAGHMVARTLSGADGQYRLAGNGSATAVRAIRIGFSPATRSIAAGDSDVVANVALTILPTLLETVEVQVQPSCPASENAPAAFALWEQARAALLASVVAREVNPPTVRMVSYTRILDAEGKRIVQQVVSDSIYVASRPVISARTAEQFAILGYRGAGEDAQHFRYFAPDADVLLDSEFVRRHCLSYRADDPGHTDTVGIAFTPVPGNDSIVDIDGVLWLNRAIPGLASLTFRYTNLTARERSANSGGDLTFTETPSGVAMISRWNLHMPMMAKRPVNIGPFIELAGPRVVGITDAGGELAEASWKDGSAWMGPLASIAGIVVPSIPGQSVADIPVRIRGSRIETRTEADGTFTLPLTVPGPYVIDAVDQLMADAGVELTGSATVTVDRSPVTGIRVQMPSRKTSLAALCSADRGNRSRNAPDYELLIGKVRFATGAPAPGAFVRVDWQQSSDSSSQTIRFSGTADSTATFRVCGTPTTSAVMVSAARDSLLSPDVGVTIDSLAGIGQVELVLATPSTVKLPAYRRRRIDITDGMSHLPLPGVEVLEESSDRRLGVTFGDGSVSLAALPSGRSLLLLRKVGYGQQTVIVDVDPQDTLPVAVSMQTVAQLAAVKVTVDAIGSRLAYESGFADRARAGLGHFLWTKDFERRPTEKLANVLLQLGVSQKWFGISGTILLGGHGMFPCPVTIYLDGALFYASGLHQPIPDVSSMMGIDFAAAEYYGGPSEAPPEYNATGTSECGVLLLWRKN